MYYSCWWTNIPFIMPNTNTSFFFLSKVFTWVYYFEVTVIWYFITFKTCTKGDLSSCSRHLKYLEYINPQKINAQLDVLDFCTFQSNFLFSLDIWQLKLSTHYIIANMHIYLYSVLRSAQSWLMSMIQKSESVEDVCAEPLKILNL